MTNKLPEQIKGLLHSFTENVDEGIQENVETERMDEYHSSIYTTYSIKEDTEDLLLKIGKLLGNETLIELFKKPKTIEEIVSELNEGVYLEDFEEIELIERTSDADRCGPKYIYIDEIVKYIPDGKIYYFTTQTQGDHSEAPEFVGEVIKKEIVTTKWVTKNDK
jgi:hypothetical protein